MATDRMLAGNFWLHEFPCWEQATEADVALLQETTQRVLQPVRQRFGTTIPSSWKWWRTGCRERVGAHAMGGTVDFVTPEADLVDVYEWGKTYLLPSGYIGRWIYEPERSAEDGVAQGEHIHMAPRADMLAYNGDGSIQALREVAEGRYVMDMEYFDGEGTGLQPFELPGIQVAGVRGFSWLWLFLGAGVFVTLARGGFPRTSST